VRAKKEVRDVEKEEVVTRWRKNRGQVRRRKKGIVSKGLIEGKKTRRGPEAGLTEGLRNHDYPTTAYNVSVFLWEEEENLHFMRQRQAQRTRGRVPVPRKANDPRFRAESKLTRETGLETSRDRGSIPKAGLRFCERGGGDNRPERAVGGDGEQGGKGGGQGGESSLRKKKGIGPRHRLGERGTKSAIAESHMGGRGRASWD